MLASSSSAVVAASHSFVPSASALGALRIVPVPGFARGAVPVSSVVEPGSGDFLVWFAGRSEPLVCRASTFGGVVPAELVSAVSAAGAAGVAVFPVVAVFGRRPASGFFCGVSADLVPRFEAPVPGSFA